MTVGRSFHTHFFGVLLIGCLLGHVGTLQSINMTISAEKRLMRYLLEKYKIAGKEGRPVINNTDVTPIQFSLGLIQMDLNEKEKVLTTSMWTRMSWVDQYLIWDPTQYDRIQKLRFEADQIWIPDVMLFNTADVKTETRKVFAIVQSDGRVQWYPHQIFSSSCSIDVTDFPFDKQKFEFLGTSYTESNDHQLATTVARLWVCHMWFGSWTHNNLEFNLTMPAEGGLDLKTFQADFKEISEWEILNTVTETIEQEPGGFTALSFELRVRRKLAFTSYILTLPCIFLAALTLVVFILPPERPDRTGLAMSLFSSFLLLLLILVEAAPPTASSVPKLGLYYCFNMVLIMVSIFLSSLVVNINKLSEKKRRAPRFIKVIFLHILAKLLCIFDGTIACTVQKPTAAKKQHACTASHCTEETSSLINANHTACERNRSSANEKFPCVSCDPSHSSQSIGEFTHCSFNSLQCSINDVRTLLIRISDFATKRTEENTESKAAALEWKNISRVCDRIFFLMYLCGVVIPLFTLFPRPDGWSVPH